MKCPKCNTENRPGAKFCDNCGVLLPSADSTHSTPIGEPSVSPSTEDTAFLTIPEDVERLEPDASNLTILNEEREAVQSVPIPSIPTGTFPVVDGSMFATESSDEKNPLATSDADDLEPDDSDFESASGAIPGLDYALDDMDPEPDDFKDISLSGAGTETSGQGASLERGGSDPRMEHLNLADSSAGSAKIAGSSTSAQASDVIGKGAANSSTRAVSSSPTSTGDLLDRTNDLTGLETLVGPGYDASSSSHDEDTLQMGPAEQRSHKAKSFNANAQSSKDKKVPKNTPSPSSSGSIQEVEASSVKMPMKNSTKAVIIAVCVIAAILAIVGLSYYFQLWGGKIIPDVLGMSEQEATSTLLQQGFEVETKVIRSDDKDGIVLLVDPSVGQREAEGSTVTLSVSTSRVIPQIVGMSLEEARTAIDAEGFTNVTYTEIKSDDAHNTVLTVNPEAGTQAKAAQPIAVEVAVPYTVPDVIGQDVDQAKGSISEAGYSVNTLYTITDSVPEGDAVSTDPEAGTVLPSGSQVTLYIARNRADAVIEATYDYLVEGASYMINGTNYVIGSIDSVSYQGSNVASYTVSATPFTSIPILGDIAYGSSRQISGTITWSDNLSIIGSDPGIERLSS